MSRPTANRVRIIGGACRGRTLRFPPREAVRPTPDRVRETLFNWLGQDLTGWSTLDPFAGSGALSLEALSRGAALAVAVDREPTLVRALRDNARVLGFPNLEVHRADAQAFLAEEPRQFDAVFLDPPFGIDALPALIEACAARIRPSGRLYVESSHRVDPPAGLAVLRADRAGQVYYHLLARVQGD